MPLENTNTAAHTDVTLALAKQEHSEHMAGMKEAKKAMGERPLIVKAYALDDPNAPKDLTAKNVKVVHWVRHGQGFHNLMADLAKQQGRTWIPVSEKGQCDMLSHVDLPVGTLLTTRSPCLHFSLVPLPFFFCCIYSIPKHPKILITCPKSSMHP